MSAPLTVIILAAGQGTRMRSRSPKVLHAVGGKPMLQHVLDTAHTLNAEAVHVVYGHGGEQVLARVTDPSVQWVLQGQQLGTGHAVAQAMPGVADGARVLVLYGDVPLITASTLQRLLAAAEGGLALLTVDLPEPKGYGRIVRDGSGQVCAIVEEKDASGAQKAITEVNTGMLAVAAGDLRRWLGRLKNNNAQGEYYLTDIVAMAVADGVAVTSVTTPDPIEVAGVNNRAQLAEMERALQHRHAEAAMAAGATLLDPARFDVRGELVVGQDVVIDVNCVFEGRVVLGDNVRIGPNCYLRDVEVATGVQLLANTVIEEAVIGPDCRIGPFSRIRPDTTLAGHNHIGNFVEVKKSSIGEGSKVNHLTYIGDTVMGSGVNIGAGTITANYDGANKHQTVIEDNASTGSNSVLVAPVRVGKGATLGAGTVLRKDAPEGQLTMSVIKQQTLSGWKRPEKKK